MEWTRGSLQQEKGKQRWWTWQVTRGQEPGQRTGLPVLALAQRSCVALGEPCRTLYLSLLQSRGNLIPMLVSIMPAGRANVDENSWSIVNRYPQVRRGFLIIAGEQREEGSQLAPTANFYKPEPEDLVLGLLLPLSPWEWTQHRAVNEWPRQDGHLSHDSPTYAWSIFLAD